MTVSYGALALITGVTYLPTLPYPLIYDDLPVIERNPVVTDRGGWHRVVTDPWWPRTESLDPLYRPLTTITFKLNHAVFGPDATSFRAVNIVLHALVTILVAALAGALWSNRSSLITHHSSLSLQSSVRSPQPSLPAAWSAGILFAVHPIHAEALGLVVGRAELLATLFVCLLLLRHLSHAIRNPLGYHITTALLFLAALGSKESAVVAWPMVLLIDLWRSPRGAGWTAWRAHLDRLARSHHLGLILALAAFLFARWLIFRGRTTLPGDLVNPYANPLHGASAATYGAAGFALLWLMLRQWFAAAPLSPIWSVGGFNLPSSLIRGDIIAGGVVALGLLIAVVLGRKRLGRLWLLGAIFALSILLPCHFIPAANWLYAERWAYLPSVFLALACAGLAAAPASPAKSQISDLKSEISNLKSQISNLRFRVVRTSLWRARITVAGSTLVAALLFAVTWNYQRCWADQETFFRSTVERQPYNYHGNVGLLSVLERTGRLHDARPHAERLVQRFPNAHRAWYYLALAAAEAEDWPVAETALRRWAALRPLDPIPPQIDRVAEQLRARGRGHDLDL